MLRSQTNPESIQDSTAHGTPITQEEFLENDFEGYEYAKGELVPMAPPSMEHGEISINIIRYLDLHVLYASVGTLVYC